MLQSQPKVVHISVMVLFSILPPGSLINYWLQIALAQKKYSFWAIASAKNWP
ncbi:MAG: hypothetical protein KME55_18025 [Nostoc indistinguendum CM1-VF10]|jgi:hypothetical protein|nr:hypothetical protein [Nostoc indistinguendum CM1-VF10]